MPGRFTPITRLTNLSGQYRLIGSAGWSTQATSSSCLRWCAMIATIRCVRTRRTFRAGLGPTIVSTILRGAACRGQHSTICEARLRELVHCATLSGKGKTSRRWSRKG